MIIYKFGGASVKDAAAIKNICQIIGKVKRPLTVVISAIGTTTNLLEEIVDAYFSGNDKALELFDLLKENHTSVIDDLFEEVPAKVSSEINALFIELKTKISKPSSDQFNFEYDQVIGFGELLSTTIVATYLNHIGQNNKWIDVRTCLDSDDNYVDANILWDSSKEKANAVFPDNPAALYITQGFIARDPNGFTTSLGREGSDYTAAILAHLLGADKMIIWKDVLGILNADPDYFDVTTKLDLIPYHEAIELSYYGARVIHPKTIKPLQAKKIPLWVKSFIDPSQKGTLITKGDQPQPLLPNYIVKKRQLLVTLKPLNFSFIGEKDLVFIFTLVTKYRIKLNFTQNTAVSFAFCANSSARNMQDLVAELEEKYEVELSEDLELITVRHYTPATIEEIQNKHHVLVEQKNSNTAIYLTVAN
ncbi:aspartate kinase [Labilibaculum euxinus]|uniref:Aspartokinase n=1 Tax=Labilibaculum euxinus TaxID=2686357 RepID=A0A7M4D9V9_9BACT|nr:aspartate kinase [Labilibaculum euxinus]MUP39438.1 aspartate kinase [Labilibaculum euxinus]MVB08643.1 aspartate kinase [Labilibaculum euxinus]